MTIEEVRKYLLPPLFNAAIRAGAAIMEAYRHRTDADWELEPDLRPINIANRTAHRTIREYLGPTRIPVLSEEGREMLYDERRNWEMYWLVDPLDGTAEFIRGNNEFTVNIALMAHNRCIGAVIYVPYLHKIYMAAEGTGAFVKEQVIPDADADFTFGQITASRRRLPFECEAARSQLRVAVSRSHRTVDTEAALARLRKQYPDMEVVEQGSSYKFCLLAEGRVDYYIRTTQTYEWDTAAGELILSEAGGETRTLPDGRMLLYNEEDLRNPWFVCRSKFCKIQNAILKMEN